MKKNKKIIDFLVFVFMLVVFATPFISFAKIVPDCNEGLDCNFGMFMQLVDNVINFLIGFSVSVSAIMFAYAGFTLVTSGEQTAEAKTKAKNIFMNAVLGLSLSLGAFLIIKTILAILGYKGGAIFGF